MKKFNIGIGHDNKEFAYLLSSFLRKEKSLEIVFVELDIEKSLLLAKKESVDVLILDLEMPHINTEKVKEVASRCKIIGMVSDEAHRTKEKAKEMDIQLLLVKPIEIEEMIQQIKQLVKNPSSEENEEVERKIAILIQEHGIPLHVKGYYYLKEAIYMVYEEPYIINSITKIIYPKIARKYNTTPSCVERAVRHAITITYEKKGEKKPKNGEFIARFAESVRLDK